MIVRSNWMLLVYCFLLPASLAQVRQTTFQLGLEGGYIDGKYRNRGATLDSLGEFGGLGEFALGVPIPNLPLIFEHLFSLSIGWQNSHWKVDVGYSLSPPSRESVSNSGLLSGEYDNSQVEVALHQVGLTFGRSF